MRENAAGKIRDKSQECSEGDGCEGRWDGGLVCFLMEEICGNADGMRKDNGGYRGWVLNGEPTTIPRGTLDHPLTYKAEVIIGSALWG